MIAAFLALVVLAKARRGAAMSGDAEYGYTIFERGGQFLKGQEAIGTRYNVTVPTDGPPGYRPLAIYHTHPPEALLEPSQEDIDAARQSGVPVVCVGRADGTVECFRI